MIIPLNDLCLRFLIFYYTDDYEKYYYKYNFRSKDFTSAEPEVKTRRSKEEMESESIDTLIFNNRVFLLSTIFYF